MRIGLALARIPPRLAFWALAGVALLVSHDAVFLVQLGPGDELTRALRAAGHDYWAMASLTLAIAGLAAGIVAILRLRSLRLRAARLGVDRIRPGPALPGRLAATWLRLFVVVGIGFVLQESVEHRPGAGGTPVSASCRPPATPRSRANASRSRSPTTASTLDA